MSAEFIPVMSDSGGMYYTLEHDVTRYAVGDAESIRVRLAEALEQMGYRVLNENPLQARRGAKVSARSGCSQNILDYQTMLNVGLKSAGTNSTRVTFDYEVKGVYTGRLSKNDRNTLTREAEAILAQATARAASHCSACGADAAGSSRFCRQCGSPLHVATPPEVEVLRMTANANASYKNIASGTFFILFGAACLLVLLFGSDDPIRFARLVKALSFVSATLGGLGLTMLLMGIFRLRQTLRRDIEPGAAPAPSRRGIQNGPASGQGSIGPETGGAPTTAALPPPPISHSVTEVTTDLLPDEVKRAS